MPRERDHQYELATNTVKLIKLINRMARHGMQQQTANRQHLDNRFHAYITRGPSQSHLALVR